MTAYIIYISTRIVPSRSSRDPRHVEYLLRFIILTLFIHPGHPFLHMASSLSSYQPVYIFMWFVLYISRNVAKSLCTYFIYIFLLEIFLYLCCTALCTVFMLTYLRPWYLVSCMLCDEFASGILIVNYNNLSHIHSNSSSFSQAFSCMNEEAEKRKAFFCVSYSKEDTYT